MWVKCALHLPELSKSSHPTFCLLLYYDIRYNCVLNDIPYVLCMTFHRYCNFFGPSFIRFCSRLQFILDIFAQKSKKSSYYYFFFSDFSQGMVLGLFTTYHHLLSVCIIWVCRWVLSLHSHLSLFFI